MKRLLPAMCLFVAACLGNDAVSTTTSAPPATPPTTSSSSSAATSTTGAVTTTEATAPPTTLDDGRPATFLAVTTDYEAVEIDTATGDLVHSYGQRATAGDLGGDEFAPNVVDALWRTSSGAMVLVSECCEPAAGRINYLPRDGVLRDDYADPGTFGWAVAPSPGSDEVIIIGYSTVLTIPDPTAAGDQLIFLENDGSGIGAIGWGSNAALIHWYDDATDELVTWDPTASVDDTSRTPIDWIAQGQRLSGLGVDAAGRLVSFLSTWNGESAVVATELVRYSAGTGELIDRLDLEAGSAFGGFDQTGTHLIYTTGDGVVRSIGPGGIETLAEGFLFASW